MSRKSFLLIDDNIDMLPVVQDATANLHFAVDFSNNALEALEKLRHNKYDFIICDIKIPQMDGIKLIKKIRTDENIQTPVLFISGEINDEYVSRINLIKSTFLLEKPFRLFELRRKINEIAQHTMTSSDKNIKS